MADNSYTSDRRLYLDADGNVVEADDPNRNTLLVAKGGTLSATEAAKYGLSSDSKAMSKAPENKQMDAPEATKADIKAEFEDAGPIVEVEADEAKASKKGKKG